MSGTKGAERRAAADKHRIGLSGGAAILHVRDDGVTHLLGQGQPGEAATLATDVNPATPPVDVAETQLPDVAGAQPQSSEEQQHRPIPPSHR
jgi:hypothetical protein